MDQDIVKYTYGFVGAGNMAWAIFQNLLKAGVPSKNVIASAPSKRNLEKWKAAGAATTHNNDDTLVSQIVFLAIKPQQFLAVVDEGKQWVCPISEHGFNPIFISVIAGIPTHLLTDMLSRMITPKSYKNAANRIIRVMPNTPLCVGYGCTVMCKGLHALDEDLDLVKQIFSGHGCLAEIVPESMMDAAGVVAGCGPAYMYLMLEAMADGAVKQGVPRSLASTLAAQAMLGAAQMVLNTGKNPAQLKDEVCSPAGTTIAGLHALKKAPNFSTAVMDAIEAATIRCKELAGTSTNSTARNQ